MKALNSDINYLTKENAYWMARISRAAYMKRFEKDPYPDETGILESLKKEDNDFLSVKGVSKNSAQAVLVEHKNYLCIAFRGTDEILDWLDNINIRIEDSSFGRFHKGFRDSVNDVWDVLFERYNELKRINERPLFLTGHSLGGAMASIAAAKLIDLGLSFNSVYTFGQPRAMDRKTSGAFDKKFKSVFFRFHNNNDIVTRVPAALSGYRHVGTYIYISEEEILYKKSSFWFRLADYIDGAFDAFKEKGIDIVRDHNMDHYLAAIEKWNCVF